MEHAKTRRKRRMGTDPQKIRDDAKIEFDEEKRHQGDALSGAAFDGSRSEVDVGREL
jgi:hypothetical protein